MAKQSRVPQQSMIGGYGRWFAGQVLGDAPARLSLRSGRWKSLPAWRRAARTRLHACLAMIDSGGAPKVRVESQSVSEGLHIEHLSWQLPYGPRTEAVLLKPAGARGRLPGVLGLHDHGGNKFLGWRKIARGADRPWAAQVAHQADSYDGVAWANALARAGYVVLVHDAFPFASRRVRVADVPESIREDGVDPDPADLAGIERYNAFARAHEHLMAKSLFCAGTTWPGVYVAEDQRALDVLCARPEVDPARVGCGGLSGGGMRTVFLGGLDARIRCAVPAGFMTTWRDLLLAKCFTHTWMAYLPLLPRDLDFPEILGLNAPPTLVLNCREDALFSLPEMRRADRMLAEVYARQGRRRHYRCRFHSGGHRLDRAMQAEAFAWFDRHLK